MHCPGCPRIIGYDSTTGRSTCCHDDFGKRSPQDRTIIAATLPKRPAEPDNRAARRRAAKEARRRK